MGQTGKRNSNEVFTIARKGKMVEKEIESSYLKETLLLKMYQPEMFSPLYKYHICIMQDGDDYFQLGRAATLSDKLHASEEIEHTVLVGIHYRDKYDRQRKYHPSGEQQQAYISFLAHEVIPLLDEIIPGYHMGHSRALVGDSLAGTLALMTAMKYPHTFSKVIMQSPYVDKTVLDSVKDASDMQGMAIYHTIGENETAVDTTDRNDVDFLTPNRELHDLLQAKNVNYQYQELSGGEHTWKYWQKDLPNALRAMLY